MEWDWHTISPIFSKLVLRPTPLESYIVPAKLDIHHVYSSPHLPLPHTCVGTILCGGRNIPYQQSGKNLSSHRARRYRSIPASPDIPSVQTLMNPMISPISSLKNFLITRQSRITSVICLNIPLHAAYVYRFRWLLPTVPTLIIHNCDWLPVSHLYITPGYGLCMTIMNKNKPSLLSWWTI